MKLSRLKERLRHGADVCQITQQKIVASKTRLKIGSVFDNFRPSRPRCSLVCPRAI